MCHLHETDRAVILSGFDPFRREIARVALERLISDGRIHPARIEEVAEKVKAEFETRLQQEGESALLELNIPDVHPDLVKLLGRLRYRTSYGQNVLKHSKEVAYLAATMAAELRSNVHVAKRAGLLHDIGKSVDREMEGSHLQLRSFVNIYLNQEDVRYLDGPETAVGENDTLMIIDMVTRGSQKSNLTILDILGHDKSI